MIMSWLAFALVLAAMFQLLHAIERNEKEMPIAMIGGRDAQRQEARTARTGVLGMYLDHIRHKVEVQFSSVHCSGSRADAKMDEELRLQLMLYCFADRSCR
jgi:hypothetical protein